jgi:hypothetical protein
MRTILIGLAVVVIIILLALLALLVIMRAGIRHQERAACLICHPPGLSTAIARRVVRLHSQAPDFAHECRHTYRGPAAVANDQPRLSTKKEAAS